MSHLRANADRIRERLTQACEASGRDPSSVEILAVSKFHPSESLREAQSLGFNRFGENYVQEGQRKSAEVPGAQFILIGPLQRNKAKPALLHFAELMTVDRPELVHRLRNLAEELDVVRPIWFQVDLWGESTKLGGCGAADLEGLLGALQDDPRLPLKGFMAIPPPDHPDAFQELAHLRAHWQQRLGCQLLLSMGMSEDLEEAVAAGSDQVRIGTALFGSR